MQRESAGVPSVRRTAHTTGPREGWHLLFDELSGSSAQVPPSSAGCPRIRHNFSRGGEPLPCQLCYEPARGAVAEAGRNGA